MNFTIGSADISEKEIIDFMRNNSVPEWLGVLDTTNDKFRYVGIKDETGIVCESDEANLYGSASLLIKTKDDEYSIELNLYPEVRDGKIVSNPNYTFGCKSAGFSSEGDATVEVDWNNPNWKNLLKQDMFEKLSDYYGISEVA